MPLITTPRNKNYGTIWCILRAVSLSFGVLSKISMILHPYDRKACKKYSCYMKAFRDCLTTCELLELPLCGKKFTWSRGRSASRIDRAFMSTAWFQTFPSASLFGFPKYTSDPRPIMVKMDSTDWGS